MIRNGFSKGSWRVAALTAALVLAAGGSGTLAAESGGVDREGKPVSTPADRKPPTPEEALKLFTENLTAKAKAGQTEKFVGGRVLIQEIVELLSKKSTKLMFLIGERGAGKTALVEALAGQLNGKEIYSLSISKLYAGTTYRGMLEENISATLEAFRRDPNKVLFIDEVSELGKPDRETLRNELLPPLARGEISSFMVTTEDEFSEVIESDEALTSRGLIKRLDQPNEAKLLDILRSKKEGLQQHHGINITDGALKKIAKLVLRYYFSEARARKAIEIADGAMAREVISRRMGNYDLAELKDRKESVELHIASLKHDLKVSPNQAQKDELKDAEDELAAIETQITKKSNHEEVQKKRDEISQARQDAATAEKKGLLQEASQIRYLKIPFLQSQLDKMLAEPGTGEDINEKHVAKYVARDKRISISVTAADETQLMKNLEDELNRRVLFQEHANEQIVRATKIRRANVEAPRPVWILLDGPTGVGKSEVARSFGLSYDGIMPHTIYGNKYQSGNSSWRLYGSDPGYKDSEAGGDLEPLRRNPQMTLSIDEANLADISLWQSLYQLSSEGFARDNRNRVIEGRYATVLIQGNFTGVYSIYRDVWSEEEIEKYFRMEPGTLAGRGFSKDEIDQKVMDRALELRGWDAPMRARVVKILFRSLDLPKLTAIARQKLADQEAWIYQEHKVIVVFDDSVAEAVARAGYEEEMGARPVDRSRSDNVSDLLADLAPQFQKGQVINVHFEKNAEGTGGKMIASNGVSVPKVKNVIYNTISSPRAQAADRLGDAGHQPDLFDTDKVVERAMEKVHRK
jgi:ATP-dependent Clp protease ATP-binding subunit ClpB